MWFAQAPCCLGSLVVVSERRLRVVRINGGMLRVLRLVCLLAGGMQLAGCAAPAASSAAGGLHPRLRFETSLGRFVVELDAERAPQTVINFVQLVRDGTYNGTIFHRVLPDGLVQGGAFTPDLERRQANAVEPLSREWNNGLESLRGTIVMCRAFSNAKGALPQFFINIEDNPDFDVRHADGGGYTVFGRVIEGMAAVDHIGRTPVGRHPKYAGGNSRVVPLDPVVIKRVRLVSRFDGEVARAQVQTTGKTRVRPFDQRVAERIKEIEKSSGVKIETVESGLKYADVRVGHGPRPIMEDTVLVNYSGTLVDGTEFESTYLKDAPLTQEITRFIPGLQEGLMSMNEGGKRIMIIPPGLGFGIGGIPGRIPPGATLFFELELLEIK